MDEIIKAVVVAIVETMAGAIIKHFSSPLGGKESHQRHRKVAYPLGANEVPHRLQRIKQLIDSESAIRIRSYQQRESLNRTEWRLFAKGVGFMLLLLLLDTVFWLESLVLIGVDINEVKISCAIVMVLFIPPVFIEFGDRTADGAAWRRIETGFWIGLLCIAGGGQIAVLNHMISEISHPVTSWELLTTAVCALVLEVLCIFFWHKLIRSHYDVKPFKMGFPFTQTGFQSFLSAGNHCRRVREQVRKACKKEKSRSRNERCSSLYEQMLLCEQRLLRPHQLNVIDAFTWEGQGVHFLDATIGRPPWQNPGWHFQQVARLERMHSKDDEENLEHTYAKSRQTKKFLDLCCSVAQPPLHSDDAEAETPSDDAHKISRYVEEYLKEYNPRKNDYILCFSHHGICSMLVTLRLLQLGYEHTYDLGECAVRYPLINVKAQELTVLSVLAQEEDPGKILELGNPSLHIS